MDQLLAQLIRRTETFKEKTGLSSRQIGKLTGISEQHLCDLLAGRKGLSTKSTMRLLQVINSGKAQLAAKLGTKVVHLEHYQENGLQMKLAVDGSGWVSREGDSAADPNNRGS